MKSPEDGRTAGGSDSLAPLARAGILNLFGVAWGGVFSYVLVFVLARGLGPREFGLFSVAVALFAIVSNIGELGADTGLLRQIPRLLSERRGNDVRPVLKSALVPVLLVGIGLSVAVAVWAPHLTAVLIRGGGEAEAASYLRALAPFLAVGAATTVVLTAVRGFGKQKFFVLVQNLGIPTARPPLVLAVLAFGAGGAWLAIAWAAPLLVGLVVGLGFLVVLVRRTEDLAVDDSPESSIQGVAVEFWRFTWVRGFAGAFAITQTWMNLLFVSALGSARDAGVFNAVIRYVILGAFAFQAVRVAIGPQISTLIAHRRWTDTEAVFQTATWWLMVLSWPYYLLLAVCAPTAMGFLGHGYVSGATALSILCVASLVNMGTGNVTLVLLMGGRSSWNLANILAALSLNVVLSLLLVPRYGVTGAAIAWGAATVLENVLAVVQVALFMHLRPFGAGYRWVATSAVACFAVLGVLLRLATGSSAATLAVTAVVGTPLYGWLLWRRRNLLHFDVLSDAVRNRRSAIPQLTG